MRRMELMGLAVPDPDMERGTVMIRKGKGKKDRVVPIGERAVRWIQKYYFEVRPRLLPGRNEPTLFLTGTGEPLEANTLTCLVRQYVTAADLGKKGACHLFRHTCATLMLENGADVRFIQQMLGHAKLETTAIYTQVSIRKLKEVHERTHPARMERTERVGSFVRRFLVAPNPSRSYSPLVNKVVEFPRRTINLFPTDGALALAPAFIESAPEIETRPRRTTPVEIIPFAQIKTRIRGIADFSETRVTPHPPLVADFHRGGLVCLYDFASDACIGPEGRVRPTSGFLFMRPGPIFRPWFPRGFGGGRGGAGPRRYYRYDDPTLRYEYRPPPSLKDLFRGSESEFWKWRM